MDRHSLLPSRSAIERHFRSKGYTPASTPQAVITEIAKTKLFSVNPDTGNLYVEDLVDRWIRDAVAGRYYHLRELLDRIEGRLPPGRDDVIEREREIIIQYVNDWRNPTRSAHPSDGDAGLLDG